MKKMEYYPVRFDREKGAFIMRGIATFSGPFRRKEAMEDASDVLWNIRNEIVDRCNALDIYDEKLAELVDRINDVSNMLQREAI